MWWSVCEAGAVIVVVGAVEVGADVVEGDVDDVVDVDGATTVVSDAHEMLRSRTASTAGNSRWFIVIDSETSRVGSWFPSLHSFFGCDIPTLNHVSLRACGRWSAAMIQACKNPLMADVFHLGINRSDLDGAEIAIIPGDPQRVVRIAAAISESEGGGDITELANTREFRSALTSLDGVPIVVCSTGIGGPSTSIAVEELAQLGVRTFLRIGTTGSIQPHVDIGDVIITQAAVRLDGASQHFAPLEYPAASSFECTRALADAADLLGYRHHVGITASSDTFYPGQERYDTVAGDVTTRFKGSLAEWQRLHVLNYEMESATLFTMCSANGWRGGCVATVIANRIEEEIPKPVDHTAMEKQSILVVIEAIRSMNA